MRLESALNTGREGITAHGQAIAVVGDNISNANTVGYKNQRAIFAAILGEVPGDRGAEVVSGAGDGVTVREIQTDYGVGPITPTGRELDVALSGKGFFQVGDVANIQYTRSGSFALDENGMLVTNFGLPVLGYTGADVATLGPIDMKKVQVDIVPTSQSRFFGNLSSTAITSTPLTNPLSFQEINRGAAYTNVASVFDSLGQRHEVVFAYYRQGVNAWNVQAYVNGSDVGRTPEQPVLVGQTDITFDTSGRISQPSIPQSILNARIAWGNGAAASEIGFDFGAFTQFAGSSLIVNITQNGQGAGEIVGYEINGDGAIFARLSSGGRAQVGSLGIASVPNEDGLVRSGTSTYAATEKAGVIQSGLAGTGGRGEILSASLEYSNVDLAGQFVELVILQRAYGANSKVISTANEIIRDTLALVR